MTSLYLPPAVGEKNTAPEIKKNKSLIQSIINVFETGRPEGDYSALTIYPDARGGKRQITYGRSQTTETSHLPALLRNYITAGGEFSAEISKKMHFVGTGELVDDIPFLQLLRAAGRDPIMQKCQDDLFDTSYWQPAHTWATANGFTLPLSGLVIYDSFIHSGRIPDFLRACFPQKPPADGGDERTWTEHYVQARHRWLTFHTRPLLQKTTYRTRCFLQQIDHGNWSLEKRPINANGIFVS